MFYVFEELPNNMEEFIATSLEYMFIEDALDVMDEGYIVDDYLTIIAYADSRQADVELRDGVLTFWRPIQEEKE